MFDGSEGIIWPMWMVLSLSKGWGLNKNQPHLLKTYKPKFPSAQAISLN
jgi:hypothetical protein